MRIYLIFATLLLSFITFVPTLSGQTTCSCSAPDGSCAPRVRCPTGCTALCGSNDACYAGCGSVEAAKSNALITLKIQKKDSAGVAASLTSHSGRKIKFIPRSEKDLFSIELNNDPLWKALKFLNKRGTVLVDGTRFDRLEDLRHKMLKGEKVSVNFTGIPISDAVAKLAFVTGLPFRVVSGDEQQLLSVSLQEVTLVEIVSRISEQAGVKIEQTEK